MLTSMQKNNEEKNNEEGKGKGKGTCCHCIQ
jgi:hypothetical protein